MPSEQRLHPLSMLFMFGKSLRALILPALVVLFTTGRPAQPRLPFDLPPGAGNGSPLEDFERFTGPAFGWEGWTLLFLVPAAVLAVARYLSFRLRYEGTELVIRSGILVRKQRHIPYARIQNLDAVQGIFHRLFGVIEVRVETGGGAEPEATISVLPRAAFDEMRRRVFEGRARAVEADDAADDEAPASGPTGTPAPRRTTLLELPVPELLRYGVVENRGLVVIGAALGLLWELGLLERVGRRLFGEGTPGSGWLRETAESLVGGDPVPFGRAAALVVAIAAVLLVIRLVSMAWSVVRLYGFRLTRVGEDLQTEFGLLTRVSATIPLRRVQTLTIREAPLQRLIGRVSVRVETAGGGGPRVSAGGSEREWLAPAIRPAEVPALVRQVLPEVDLTAARPQPVAPRAFRRVVKRTVAVALVLSALVAAGAGPWGLAAAPPLIAWAVLAAARMVARLGWQATDDVVIFWSGWLWRQVTVARVAKIQAVTLAESPFDRRSGMARVRVDTAGASERSHRVDVPFLPRETAAGLYRRLAAQAAETTFRW